MSIFLLLFPAIIKKVNAGYIKNSKKRGKMMIKVVLFVLSMIACSSVYCMNHWNGLIACSQKIAEKRQELEKINAQRNVILAEIKQYSLEKEKEHHRVIHRGVEPENIEIKAKL
jgi:cell division protein FtsB